MNWQPWKQSPLRRALNYLTLLQETPNLGTRSASCLVSVCGLIGFFPVQSMCMMLSLCMPTGSRICRWWLKSWGPHGRTLGQPPKKCVIGWGEIQRLGNLLAQRQVRPQLDKSIAITSCLRPRFKNDVRWFTWLGGLWLWGLHSQLFGVEQSPD